MASDPFVVLAEDWMPRDTFPLHPHRGIETVTFVIEGTLGHRDSAGNSGIIHPGDAQWMTAGRGIRHEENPPPGEIVHLLQLWINLPAASKMVAPRYQELGRDALPIRREPGFEARVFSGRSGSLVSPTLNYVPVTMVDVTVEEGRAFREELPATDNAFVYILQGVTRIGEAGAVASAGQLAWLTRTEDPGSSVVELAAVRGGARLLIVSGRPLREPIAMGGPFVMNTPAQIEAAFADYRAGRF